MEGSFLSPEETKYYSELFTRYDAEKTGKLSNHQALALFVSSNIQTNQLKLISELCGADRVGHYGRSQFFIALKLIALVQSGRQLPTSVDNTSLGLEVPLPKFGEKADDQGINAGMQEFENPVFIGNARDTDFHGMNGSGLPPPPQKSRSNVSGNIILQSIDERDGSSPQDISPSSSLSASPEPLLPNASSPHAALTQEPVSPVGGSRTASAAAAAPPVASTPLTKTSDMTENKEQGIPSQADEGWAEFEKTRSKVSHQPNDQDNSWATFPPTSEEAVNHTEEKKEEPEAAKEKEEDDEDDDPWVITKEQRKYYTAQFQNLQQDLNLSIKGPDAKAFFEKSKLPTYELSKIWQLSDVNQDGTLYLEEFCTAMHLVVLRKHHISLPEKLPASLIPKLGNNEATNPPEAAPPSSAIVITPLNSRKHSGRSITPPSSESEVKSDENWATFQDSPFPGPPSPSSQTPVNFDFASISPDPDAKIFQPIPVHLAPDGKPLADGEQPPERPRTFSDPLKLERQSEVSHQKSPAKQRSMTQADTIDSTPTKIAPPPSAQKLRASKTMHLDGQDLHDVAPPPPRSRSSEEALSRSYTGPTLRSQLQLLKSQSHGPLRLDRQQALTEESEGNRSLPVGTIEPLSPLAPAPPPRKSGHNRAASLDLDKLEQLDRAAAVEPGRPNRPLIPPRPGAQNQEVNVQYTHTPKRAMSVDERHSQRTDKFHDSRQFEPKSTEKLEKDGPPQLPPRPALPEELQQDASPKSPERHHSADLDKDQEKEDKRDRRRHLSAPSSSSKKSKPKDRKAIQAAIRAAKEENVMLSRHNSELHQELRQLTEDRVSLEAQLQKLRPFHKLSSS